jgi:hypothetical protein
VELLQPVALGGDADGNAVVRLFDDLVLSHENTHHLVAPLHEPCRFSIVYVLGTTAIMRIPVIGTRAVLSVDMLFPLIVFTFCIFSMFRCRNRNASSSASHHGSSSSPVTSSNPVTSANGGRRNRIAAAGTSARPASWYWDTLVNVAFLALMVALATLGVKSGAIEPTSTKLAMSFRVRHPSPVAKHT